MNILYLHGLDASPKREKVLILEGNGSNQIIAPNLEYRNYVDDIALFKSLLSLTQKSGIEHIVGSSFGAYMGFHLSEFTEVNSTLFNPALSQKSIHVPVENKFTDTPKTLIVGKDDDVINPQETKEWIKEKNYKNSNFVELDFGHQVPLEIFAEVIKYIEIFFNSDQ